MSQTPVCPFTGAYVQVKEWVYTYTVNNENVI